ncbi:hypothetical protein BpOF4_17320 [Alkalihalophilus pseudofirmus OF4]|uniref:HAD family hydrolase n=1 Tax=Alkalihalophilus pseudofirmus (strain ATCC BAA-2126 / JCM 17055 / OF4) TaxID=398511 RepID=D3FRB4_ALKPO|nr:HAD family hydrolase [Alkalihalophilus pseudofirmus]ADC51505.1 hypothetical protein BpOF4_17320 [Alkalihalophilus pseudofirmus OF4]
MIKDIKLVLFDLDNTLLSFSEYWTEATHTIFYLSDFTKDLPFDEFFSYYRQYDQYFWELHHEGRISLDEVRQQRLIKTLDEFDQKISTEEADCYFNEFFHQLIHLVKPDQALHKYLLELKKSYQIGIITNGKVEEQRAKIQKMNLHNVLSEEEIFISEEMGIEKPHEEAFHIPLVKYGVAPSQAVYIGDSWNNDIVGAIDAGMSAIWINPQNMEAPTNHKPLFITENMLTLKEEWPLQFKEVKLASK